jgi:hypothetical protein
LSIIEQAKVIKEALDLWAPQDAGKCIIASNIYDMWAMASNNAQGARAILAYHGETIRGDFPVAAFLSRIDRQWQLAILRPQGPAPERGSQLTDPLGNNRPFYTLVEEARDIIRSLVFDANFCERQVDYHGIKSMQMVNGQVLDGYIIEFSIGTQLQMVSAVPNQFVPL